MRHALLLLSTLIFTACPGEDKASDPSGTGSDTSSTTGSLTDVDSITGTTSSTTEGTSSTSEILPTGTTGIGADSFGPCVEGECPDGQFCFVDERSGMEVCSMACESPSECPETSQPNQRICGFAFYNVDGELHEQICLMTCLPPFTCPAGLDCLEYRGSLFCG